MERGYRAVGGEAFALFLPVFYYIISHTVGDIAADMKKSRRKTTMKNLLN